MKTNPGDKQHCFKSVLKGLFPNVNTASPKTAINTQCLNGALSCVDFMDVIMGGVYPSRS